MTTFELKHARAIMRMSADIGKMAEQDAVRKGRVCEGLQDASPEYVQAVDHLSTYLAVLTEGMGIPHPYEQETNEEVKAAASDLMERARALGAI